MSKLVENIMKDPSKDVAVDGSASGKDLHL